jgi:hypothetical protein
MSTFEDLIDCDDNLLTQIFSHLKVVDLLSLKRVNHHIHRRLVDTLLFYSFDKIEDVIFYFLKRGRDHVILELIKNHSHLIDTNSYRLIVSYADKHKDKDMIQLIRQVRPNEHFPTQLNSQVIMNYKYPTWVIVNSGNNHDDQNPYEDQTYVFLRELCQLFINCSCADNILAFTTNHNLLKCHDPMISWRLFSLDELTCIVKSWVNIIRKQLTNTLSVETRPMTLILDQCCDKNLIKSDVFKRLILNGRHFKITLIIIANTYTYRPDPVTRMNIDRVTLLKGLNRNQFYCYQHDHNLFQYYRMITCVDNWFTIDRTIPVQSDDFRFDNHQVLIGCDNDHPVEQ